MYKYLNSHSRSYKGSTIINYDVRLENCLNLNSLCVIYVRRVFKKLSSY